MTPAFLFGAVIGSGLFILAGRAPAEKLIAAVQSKLRNRRR
jgi:hypothetical protein